MKRALKARWDDFEDCLVAYGAEKVSADYIITRNVKDFSQSRIEAITPEELFRRLEDQRFVFEEIDFGALIKSYVRPYLL